jgi:ElaB/YqjD/DUF883 family membrane-anchored ribosome-binding protein
VKGKIKERSERRRTTQIWKSQGRRKRKPAKFKTGSAALKRPLENKDLSTRFAKRTGGDMSQTVVERTAEHIAESAHQASRATSAIADAIDDGTEVMSRAVKQGGDAAEEFLNDTTQRIHRHPVLTVAVGVAAGTLIGWMMKRR